MIEEDASSEEAPALEETPTEPEDPEVAPADEDVDAILPDATAGDDAQTADAQADGSETEETCPHDGYTYTEYELVDKA